jgi:RNA polymerase sigma-70 factor (ECF subfamily)
MAMLSSIVAQKRPALVQAAELEQHLRAFITAARAALPGVVLDEEVLVAHLADRLPEHGDGARAIAERHAPDLYLACACMHGVPEAITLFQHEHLARVKSVIARVDPAPDFVDDTIQRLGERLLVGPNPRIGQYSGSGPLGAWLRVAATRLAFNLLRERQRAARIRCEGRTSSNFEVDVINREYRTEIESAFRLAFARLGKDERVLLLQHYVDGLPKEELARLYEVDRSTVSRRLKSARQQLLEQAHHELTRLLPRVSGLTRDSLIRAVRSQIDLGLSSLRAR